MLWFMHNSLQEVLIIITAIMAAMLAVSVVFYLFSKNETVYNNSGV